MPTATSIWAHAASWSRHAAGLEVTFHRAFDAARDAPRALEQIIALGCTRLLSSGAAASALAAHVAQAAGRIQIMVAADISLANVAEVARRTGADALHASAKQLQRTAMRHHNPVLAGLCPDWGAAM